MLRFPGQPSQSRFKALSMKIVNFFFTDIKNNLKIPIKLQNILNSQQNSDKNKAEGIDCTSVF